MDAIVTAGGTPQPGEPLYEVTQGKPKAMLDVCGKPMIQWVLDALCEAKSVDRIFIIGLPSNTGLICSKATAYLPDHGGLLQNLRAGVHESLKYDTPSEYVLFVSSDVPTIRPEMVDWVVDAASKTKEDAYYNVIKREVMEKRFPNSRRSYVKIKDIEACGSDINVLSSQMVVGEENDALWQKIIDARKNALKQAALIGLDTLFLVLFHLVTLEQAVAIVSRRLKLKVRVVNCPYAEIGMDVDKPSQLEIVRADLARRVQVEL